MLSVGLKAYPQDRCTWATFVFPAAWQRAGRKRNLLEMLTAVQSCSCLIVAERQTGAPKLPSFFLYFF
jgi:hypothetical protein